jgi:uncharacterized protein (TIGR03067 family)
MRRVLLILLAVGLFHSRLLDAGEPTGELKKLQGTWTITAMERGGELPPKELMKATVTITKEKMTLELKAADSPDGKGFARHHTIKIDSSTNPKAIDLTSLDEPNKGALMQGIYSLQDNELKFCIPDQKVDARPSEMKSPKGSSLILMTLKRTEK